MHIKVFDKAVKRYRQQHQQHNAPSAHKGHHFHFWGHHTHKHPDPPSTSQGKARSSPVLTHPRTHTQPAPENVRTAVSDLHARARESLDALPGHVLSHAETFQAYIRLFVDDGNIIDTHRGSSAKALTSAGVAEVSGTLRKLLDEIAILGGIGKATKEEILQDPDARHVCSFSPFSNPHLSITTTDSIRFEH